MSRIAFSCCAVALFAGAFYSGACSASGSDTGFGGDGNGSGNGTGNGTGKGGKSGNAGGTSGISITGDASGNSGSGSVGDASCGGDEYDGEQKPLDMYIMFDQSGSMDDPRGSPQSRWNVIKDALKRFVQDTGSADVGVGIQYFPAGVAACTVAGPNCACIPIVNICVPTGGGSCNVPDYAKPDVAIQLLPGVSGAIVTSLDAHAPGGGTPTSAALDGALQYAIPWAQQHPDRKTIVVLATDGEPQACDTNVANIAAIAARGVQAMPSVQTFVIGVGNVNALNQIAQGGGTAPAIVVTGSGPAAGDQFVAAMKAIRGAALGCEYKIPQTTGTFDPNKVNMLHNGNLIYGVADQAQCDTRGGWYYDNPSNPSAGSIRLCPASCDLVTAGGGGVQKVQVQVGCKREEIPPS